MWVGCTQIFIGVHGNDGNADLSGRVIHPSRSGNCGLKEKFNKPRLFSHASIPYIMEEISNTCRTDDILQSCHKGRQNKVTSFAGFSHNPYFWSSGVELLLHFVCAFRFNIAITPLPIRKCSCSPQCAT